MDLTTTTPAQVDTALAANYVAEAKQRSRRDQALVRLRWISAAAGTYEAGYSWNSPEKRVEAEAEIDAADAEITRLGNEAEVLEAVYQASPWTRYYLVTNSNGHVHSSTRCDTCFPSTVSAWLTEQSGMTAEALVDLAGESACTVCFPWAPVSTLSRPSRLEAPERKAAREEREAKRAERDAKKAAKALFTHDPERFLRVSSYEKLATLAAAKSWLTNGFEYDWNHPSYTPVVRRLVAQAVADKTGETVEAVLAAAAKRAAKRS